MIKVYNCSNSISIFDTRDYVLYNDYMKERHKLKEMLKKEKAAFEKAKKTGVFYDDHSGRLDMIKEVCKVMDIDIKEK